MAQKIVQVDAFAEKPFTGNPAAVCILDSAADESWMQSVAMEMNLSETAFLYPEGDDYQLRWFTPTVEVALCGHATLASAYVLFSDGHVPRDQKITFHTKSGALHAVADGEWIGLNFPATPPKPTELPVDLIRALKVEPVYVGRPRFDYLIEVASEEIVRTLAPDHSAIAACKVRGVIITARGSGEYDFVSRFFAPGAGVSEDPVTGSAHCALTPYWAGKLGRSEFTAFQASKRGGRLKVRLEGDRVILMGKALITLRGELTV
jgi:PhzF family phenazine biosynthesis protein